MAMLAPEADVIVEERGTSAVSWGAILAGGVATAALWLFMLALGAGIGLSLVSPWGNSPVSSEHAATGAGIYLVLAAIMSAAVGGYLTGRLRRRWTAADEHEVYFRDTAHGLVGWAFSIILSAGLLAGASSAMIGVPAMGVAATGQNIQGIDVAPFVDRLLRPDLNAAATTTTDGSQTNAGMPEATRVRPIVLGGPVMAETRATVGRLLLQSLDVHGSSEANGLAPEDRAYLSQIVSASTGLPAAQADKRVSDVTQAMRTAADAARKAARNLSLWLAASLLFGAFAASLAALEGGGLRDGRFRYGPRLVVVPVPRS